MGGAGGCSVRLGALASCAFLLLGAPGAALAAGVALLPHTTLNVGPGQVVNGGVGPGPLGYAFGVLVTNAGMINGDVDLRGSGSPFGNSANSFVAEPGGVLNGNLILGIGGDLFETALANPGPGQYAGVTGTVTSNLADVLWYRVAADASTSLATPTPFGTVIFDVSSGAKLTINGGNPQLRSVQFLGTGSVDITADRTSVDMGTNLDVRAPITLVSRGTLTQVHASTVFGAQSSVLIGPQTDFTNAGTIVEQDLAPNLPACSPLLVCPPHVGAVFGSGIVTNTGVISLQSADGVLNGFGGSLTVSNSGVIQELAGPSGSRGIVNANTVVNTGTISVGGVGVLLGGQASLTNAGLITSASDTAVDTNPSSGLVTIVNQSGGSISGAVYGVRVTGGGSVVSAGLIAGGVDSVIFTSQGLNSLTLQTGAGLVGDAVGNPGSFNALVLQGAGSAGVDFLNFTSLTMQGPGIWALNGGSSIPTTEVAGGTLQVGDAGHAAATLTSAITVDPGATLSGHGTVVGAVTNNGTVLPGGSIGVLTIQGAYVQAAGATLAIEATPTQSSELAVNGPATLAGTLRIVAAPGIYRKGVQFQVLTASGGIAGGFSTATASNGMGLSVTSQGGTATAAVTQGVAPLAPGASANQLAIASAFVVYPVGVSDFDPVANAIVALPSGPAQSAAFDQLGGEVYADLLTVSRDNARDFLGGMSEALEAPAARAPSGGPVVWGRAFGGWRRAAADGAAYGTKGDTEGVIFGMQADAGKDAVVGASAAYSHASLALQGLAQSAALDVGAAGVYGERRWGALFVKAVLAADYAFGSGDRTLALPGIGRTAHGGAGGYALGGMVEAGSRLNAGGMTVQPSVAVLYDRIHQDGFTETGAGGADLAVASQSLDAAETLAGLRVSRSLPSGNGILKVEVRAAWAHELSDVTPVRAESFAAPGTDFILAGVRQNADAAIVGAGLSFTAGNNVELFARYDGAIGARATSHAASLGARIAW